MAKKAAERIYFKNRELVEQYRVSHPNAVMTRFIKDEADLNRTEWFGYDIAESQTESKPNQAQDTNVPEVA